MSARFLRGILDMPKLPRTKIPARVLDAIVGTPSDHSGLKCEVQYKKVPIRRRYATFGRSSGMKAGVCWPCKEELEHLKQYENKFERSFEKMSQVTQETKAWAQERRANREKTVRENLEKLPQMKKEFWQQYHQLHEGIQKESAKKEQVIQEVREFLGYDIQPNDPRFEEALAKKEEEEKAAMRAARKLDRQRQNMEMLQALVSEALEKEKESTKNVQPKPPSPQQ